MLKKLETDRIIKDDIDLSEEYPNYGTVLTDNG